MTTPHLRLDHLAKPVRRYATARKRTHLTVTTLFATAEVIAIFLTHEPAVHISLTGGVTLWEWAVIALAE